MCQSQHSCCDAATEARLMDMVDGEYKKHLAGQAGYVYDLLNSTAYHLQGKKNSVQIQIKSKITKHGESLGDVYHVSIMNDMR